MLLHISPGLAYDTLPWFNKFLFTIAFTAGTIVIVLIAIIFVAIFLSLAKDWLQGFFN